MICNPCSSAVMGLDVDPLSMVPQLPGNSSSQLQTEPPHQKGISSSSGVGMIGVPSHGDAVKLECFSSKFLS